MTTQTTDPLELLQSWYVSNCNGVWEEAHGIKIDTLDNPGWTVTIDLAGTRLSNAPFEKVDVERVADHDWFTCEVKDRAFEGVGGASNLKDILGCFLHWQRRVRNKSRIGNAC